MEGIYRSYGKQVIGRCRLYRAVIGFHDPRFIRHWIELGRRNTRFKSLKFGLKRLSKIERNLEEKRNQEARRYSRPYPGELVHFDIIQSRSLRLSLLKGEAGTSPRKYLFVGIDDFSRELYGRIYSDNGTEYKGTDRHAYVARWREAGIGEKFTRCKRPQPNGKAERVIRTLMEMWHKKEKFKGRKQRQIILLRFINFYNAVEPHTKNSLSISID